MPFAVALRTQVKFYTTMASQEIALDKLIDDIDQQLEILTNIAQDSHILNEQLRLLSEAREMLLGQDMEINRLVDTMDPDNIVDLSTLMEQDQNPEH